MVGLYGAEALIGTEGSEKALMEMEMEMENLQRWLTRTLVRANRMLQGDT